MPLSKFISSPPIRILMASVVLLALYGAFGLYVYFEKEIDRANERRQNSFQLAGKLRQSSDDLTRMVRTYVITGDPRFKKYYQLILDIRNGKIPEPVGYARPYWDLVVAGNCQPPVENGRGVALLDQMRQEGFTNDEFNKLASAKQYSDELTAMEFDAMKMVDTEDSNLSAKREQARQMLHGELYHQAKLKIMNPIKEFYILMDDRTRAAVNRAIYIAYLTRLLFIMASVWVIFILWRIYAGLRKTLGGNATEVHEQLDRIGQGDLSATIRIEPGMEHSVLAGLSRMQQKLISIDHERKQYEMKLVDSETRLQAIIDNEPECIKILDDQGRLVQMNPAGLAMIQADSFEQVSGNAVLNIIIPEHREAFAKMLKRVIAGESVQLEFEIIGLKGTRRWLESHSVPLQNEGKTVLLAVTRDITERKEHEAKLEYIAHYDPLTGIPNRIMLADRMKQAISQTSREQDIMAVCYLDLDGFKPINDALGHQAGDDVLIEIAKRIGATIRGGDTVARLGGDEFVVLLSGLSKGEECVATLERLLAAIAEPIKVKNKTVSVSTSIGVSIYPLDEEDPDILLRHADQAMYVAKQSGKNRFHIYDVALDKRARDQNEFLKSVRLALERNQFELHYQPKINLRTKELVGAEALIRWRHPERGLIAPGEFLRYLENTELDIQIGEWVTVNALAQIHQWRSIGLDIEVSINISGYHMESTGFVERLQQQLASYPNLPSGKLQIEVLETVALNDISVVQGIIESCRKIGVGFALDDFGTGYSSLSYLSALPVDTLKIDQSFVRDMLVDKGDRAIVHGIIALAKAFERHTVAEGIESEAHYHALLEMGCEIGQGYGIARPMPAGDLASWNERFR